MERHIDDLTGWSILGMRAGGSGGSFHLIKSWHRAVRP